MWPRIYDFDFNAENVTLRDQLIFRYKKSLHYPDDAKLDTYLVKMQVHKNTPSRKELFYSIMSNTVISFFWKIIEPAVKNEVKNIQALAYNGMRWTDSQRSILSL